MRARGQVVAIGGVGDRVDLVLVPCESRNQTAAMTVDAEGRDGNKASAEGREVAIY